MSGKQSQDSALGMAWWNALSQAERLQALYAVDPEGNASPADAWAIWRATGAAMTCEELCHE